MQNDGAISREQRLRSDVLVVNGHSVGVNKYLLAKYSPFFREQFFTHNNFELVDQNIDVDLFKQLLDALEDLEQGKKPRANFLGVNSLASTETALQITFKFQMNALTKHLFGPALKQLPIVFQFRMAHTYTRDKLKKFFYCTPNGLAKLLAKNLEEFCKLNPEQRANFANCFYRGLIVHSLYSIGPFIFAFPIWLYRHRRQFIEYPIAFILLVFLPLLAWLAILLVYVLFIIHGGVAVKLTALVYSVIASLIGFHLPGAVVSICKWLRRSATKAMNAIRGLFRRNRDFVLVNGSCVRVDKMSLAAKSPFFQRFFFDQRFVEGQSQHYAIDDPTLSARDFSAMCAAATQMKMPPVEQIEPILVLADRFDLWMPLGELAKHLSSSDSTPVLYKLRIAAQHGMDGLKNEILQHGLRDKLALAKQFVANALEYERMAPHERETLAKRLNQIA